MHGAGEMRVEIEVIRSRGALGNRGIGMIGIQGHGNPPGTGMSKRDNRNHRGTLGGVCTRGERFRLLAWTADRPGFAWPYTFAGLEECAALIQMIGNGDRKVK